MFRIPRHLYSQNMVCVCVCDDCSSLSENCHLFINHCMAMSTLVTFQPSFQPAWTFSEVTLKLFILPNCWLRKIFVFWSALLNHQLIYRSRTGGNMSSSATAWFFPLLMEFDIVDQACHQQKEMPQCYISLKITTSIFDDFPLRCMTFSQGFPVVRNNLQCFKVTFQEILKPLYVAFLHCLAHHRATVLGACHHPF